MMSMGGVGEFLLDLSPVFYNYSSQHSRLRFPTKNHTLSLYHGRHVTAVDADEMPTITAAQNWVRPFEDK
jgi:hypothetical protein